jgi:hypothetical protein
MIKKILVFSLLLTAGISAPAGQITPSQQTGPPIFTDFAAALIGKLPVKLMLDPFCGKYYGAMGIPVITSEKVSDLAMLIARDIIIHTLSERPDIRRALITEGQKVGIIGKDQLMSDIPEYKNLKKPELGDRRLTPAEIANYEKIRQ